jgi:multiple sugar transport system permease protein
VRWERSLWWFTAPSVSLLALVFVYPLGYCVYLSFFDYYLPVPEHRFVGLANYRELLGEARFWHSVATTLGIVVSAVTLQFGVGLAVALGLSCLTTGAARALTVLMFLPNIITPVVAALLLRWMFVGRWGLIDVLLTWVGLPAPDWLGDPLWAKATIVLADSWKQTPFVILVLYAGLMGLDRDTLEAGVMDGASDRRLVWHVILPALRPVILFVLAIRTMDGFRIFDSIYVLTGGGPGSATETMTIYTYLLSFRLLQVGQAAALGVLTLLIVTGLVGGIIGWLYRREGGAF